MEYPWNLCVYGLSSGPRYRARAIAHAHVLARAALATLQLVGICIEYAQYTCGIRMEYVWNMCGTCMAGVRMEYVWNMCGTCIGMAYVWNMYGICVE